MTNIVLKNATIIDPKSAFHKQIVDIKIQDGKIIEIGKNLASNANFIEVVEDNLHISQGWLDTSVVFGEPGFETTETLENGLKVAAKSGFTSVFLHSNTHPAIDNQAVIQFVKSKGKYTSKGLEFVLNKEC